MNVAWTAPAERELVEVWLYAAADKPDAADRLVDHLRSASNSLAMFPKLGRAGRRAETRELVVSGTNHILIYRVAGKTVEILHVRDGRRDWPDK